MSTSANSNRTWTQATIVVIAIGFILMSSKIAQAQWSGGPNIYYNGGSVGIGTSDASMKFAVNGPSRFDSGVSFSAIDTGWAAAFGYSTSNWGVRLGATGGQGVIQVAQGTTAYDLTLQPYGGKVGIGTTSPGASLHVNRAVSDAYFTGTSWGTVRIQGGTNTAGDHSTLTFDNGTGTPIGKIGTKFTNSGSYLLFGTSNNYGAGITNTAMAIDYAGNVGVGTTSPQQRLSVNYSGSNALPGVSVSETFANGSAGLTVNNTDTSTSGTPSNSAILFNVGDANRGRIKVDNNGLMTINGSGFGNDLTINSSGNVGIGTTNPGASLHVNRAVTDAYFTGTSWGTVRIQGGTNTVGDHSTLTFDNGTGTPIGKIGTKFTNSGSYLLFGTSNNYGAGITNTAMAIDYAGNVGVGTTTPSSKLDVAGSIYSSGQIRANSLSFLVWGTDASGTNRVLNGAPNLESQDAQGLELGTSSSGPVVLYTGTAERMRIDASGNVGIGKSDPGYKLDVNGTINSNSTITANNIVAKYQDVAEWVPSSEQLAAGTVVVLDSTKSNQVTSSTASYDTRVAGVVSEQPGIALGEKSGGKVLVATTGRVRVKVDATKGPIHIGDLLVTSDVAGVAMKSEAVNLGGVQFHRPGTLIGKALEPLEKGKGEILVLLSLQ